MQGKIQEVVFRQDQCLKGKLGVRGRIHRLENWISAQSINERKEKVGRGQEKGKNDIDSAQLYQKR